MGQQECCSHRLTGFVKREGLLGIGPLASEGDQGRRGATEGEHRGLSRQPLAGGGSGKLSPAPQ
ncbi:hypothetical protein E2320_011797 [Naja naja]|nr:hypothetical protein E2320_011797 [Naja naja]